VFFTLLFLTGNSMMQSVRERVPELAVLKTLGFTDFAVVALILAEALILSGMAMSVAGSSRPCSGADHEILHAIDKLYPGAGNHGELAGLGALFCAHLRGDASQAELLSACLSRHGLPRVPADLGLSLADFGKAVTLAPATRPGRYTILEHLGLSEEQVDQRVGEYDRAFAR